MKKQIPMRQIHMDFHTSPLIKGIGEAFNPEEFVDVLKKANVNSINLFAKCHHGYYYYPTKTGSLHPNLSFDLFGQQLKACKENGIRACAYTTVVWNEDWADRHPEWLQVNMDGVSGNKKPFDIGFHEWRCLCMNHAEHVQYIKDELDEIQSLYKPDGYWIDIIIQKKCVCAACLKEIQALGMNPENPDHVLKHDRIVEIRFMRDIYSHIKQYEEKPDVYFNCHPAEMDLRNDSELSTQQKRDNMTFVDIESLPSDIWGYTHFPVFANYLKKYDQSLTMMNGKFHKAWGDFGSLRNPEALDYECFRALAYGAGCCIGDQLHPDGLIDKTVYNEIGRVYKQVQEKEPWCEHTASTAQIGVFVANKVLEKADETNEGVYRMLSELHMTFDFIDCEDDLTPYELLILPDRVRIDHKTAEKLNYYLAQGGKIILNALSGLKQEDDSFASERFGVQYLHESEFSPTYADINANRFPEIPPMKYVFYEKGIEVAANAESEVLAWIADPYFNRTYDAFCSHRQTPPAETTKKPFAVKTDRVIYFTHPVFRDYSLNGNRVYRQILAECLNLLEVNPIIKTDLPTSAEITLRKAENGYVLHILHYLPQRKCKAIDIIDQVIPLYKKQFSIAINEKVKAVTCVPQKDNLSFAYENHTLSFEVPVIEGHQMICIETDNG